MLAPRHQHAVPDRPLRPVTGVMIRSSANVDAGARSRFSVILHSVLMLVAVLTFGAVLNRIPLAAVAAVLLVTGFRLAAPSLWRNAWHLGYSHFIPFVVTIVAIVFTDVLQGIGVGIRGGRRLHRRGASAESGVLPYQPPGRSPHAVRASRAGDLSQQATDLASLERIEAGDARRDRRPQDHIFKETARLRGIDYRLVGIPDTELTPTHDRNAN